MAMHPAPFKRRQLSGDQRGVTLVELMVSLVIGLLIVIAMSALFVNSSRARREVDLSSDAIESGRYALDLLTRELSQAGFYDALAAPSGTTNLPCSTTAADWKTSLSLHVVGWNSAPAVSDADPACVSRKPGTDAILVQRASTCFVGQAGCEATQDPNNAYIQVSECGTEYSSIVSTGANPVVVAVGSNPVNATTFNLQSNACDGTKSNTRRLIRRIYYISAANALTSVDLQLSGGNVTTTLVENIEQMQIEYAIANATSSGSAQTFTSTPSTADWPSVVGARIWIVSRSTDASTTAAAATSFQIGEFTGTNAVTYAAATTNPKRRVYSTYIPFTTPKSRMEPF